MPVPLGASVAEPGRSAAAPPAEPRLHVLASQLAPEGRGVARTEVEGRTMLSRSSLRPLIDLGLGSQRQGGDGGIAESAGVDGLPAQARRAGRAARATH